MEAENKDKIEAQAESVKQSLGQRLLSKQSVWYEAEQPIRDDWMKRLRAYNKVDEAENKPKDDDTFEKSSVYVGLTSMKCRAVYSRLVELEFPGGKKKNWAISPTVEPDLALPAKQLPPPPINDETIAQMQQLPPREAEAFRDKLFTDYKKQKERALNEEAARRSENMERRIDDQLTEQQFDIAFRDSLFECVVLGTGCIKGPTVGVTVSRKWAYNRDGGGWQMKDKETVVPNIDSVSMFDITWDPYANHTNDMEGIFQRHLMTRRTFRALGDMDSFDDEKISKIITESPNGNHSESTEDIELKAISKTDSAPASNRFEVFEFWGSVDGVDLHELGVDGLPEDYAAIDFDANIWICGGDVIMCALNTKGAPRIPYKIFPLEKSLYQAIGVGVPEMMDDQQYMANRAWRNIDDNAYASRFPIIEMNTDFIDPLKPASQQFEPGKIYFREGGDATAPLLRTYTVPTTINDNMAIYNMVRSGVDDVTLAPSYTHGEGQPGGSGVTRTAAGMSMLMGASNINLKSVAKNIDDYVLVPLITDIYNFNMQWSEDESIKGDMKVMAFGASSLMAQEIKLQALISFLQTTTNPMDAQTVDRPWMLRQISESLELDPNKSVKSDDELQQAQEAEKQDPMYKLQQLTMTTQVQEAYTRAMLNMAKADEIARDSDLSSKERIAKLDKMWQEMLQDRKESDSRVLQNTSNAVSQWRSTDQGAIKLLMESMNAGQNNNRI